MSYQLTCRRQLAIGLLTVLLSTGTFAATLAGAPTVSDNSSTLSVDTAATLSANEAANSLSDESTADTPPAIPDPYQGFNRAMFKFNDFVDTYFLKPIATAYNVIIPKPLNQGIHNFFNNIRTLPTIANDILQFHFYQMANDMWRLGINTTIGIGGLFDVASRMGLPYYANDFGLTLAYWGCKDSYYLVLPFLGPNTVRDAIGWPVDIYAFSIYPYIRPESAGYQLFALGVVDRRAYLLQYQSVFEEAAVDRYAFFRSAYMQRRAYEIEQNEHLDYADQIKDKPLPNPS